MRVLVVNAGSSSLKLRLIDHDDSVLEQRDLDAPGPSVADAALAAALGDGLDKADAVGHRIVHGGERFRGPVVIDADTEKALRGLADLAPLHQAKSLAALHAVSSILPGLRAVACFDTAFHATMPPAAATYALPREWRARWPLRRFGFHGLSHAYVARRAPAMLDRPIEGLRVVSCHLGAGASLCAIADGRSVDTTMGFTPLEGLVMATRSGAVDPGLILWLLERKHLEPDRLAYALEHESGLRGLAGTADLREVLARADGGDPDATLAVQVYVHRLRAGIAAMAATLGGLDALAFTGGVGEGAPDIRALAAGALGFLGVAVDPDRNLAARSDADISHASAAACTLVVAAREDLEIARQVRSVLRNDRTEWR